MTRFISTCCLTLLVACGTGSERPPAENAAGGAADEAAVRGIDSTWFAAYTAGDVDGVAALYADDAVVSVPGSPPARGSGAIREALAKDIANAGGGGFTLTPAPNSEVGVSGDLAWVWSTFTVKDKAGKTVDAGKYLTVLARRDGEWRIIRDIWNSDNAPAPPAQAASAN